MEYKLHKLQNGLTILLDFMPEIESASIRILFKVGSRDEKDSIDGISHIIEHMLFKGTHKRTAKDIAEDFDMIGGYLNAYTTKERTVYYAKVLKGDIDVGIDVLSDIIVNSTNLEEELAKEKTVIMQEISDAMDDPTDVLFEAVWQQAFYHHQIGKQIAGTHETVKSCTRPDILKYMEHYYNPKNAIVSVSGNFNEEKLLNLLNEKFITWIPTNDVSENNDIPEYVGGDVRIKKPIEQAHVAIVFNGVSIHHEDYYIHQIASIIAGGSMSSRLFQEIREKRGLAYSISAFASNYQDCGLWGVYSSTDQDSLRELVEVTIEELRKMTMDISEKELQTAKAQIKSNLLMAMESSSNRAEKLVNNMATFGRIISNEEIVEMIEKVDVAAIQKCIKELLESSKTCTVAAVGKIDNLHTYEEIVSMLNG
jgi:predicted Zn-dependent peptidase